VLEEPAQIIVGEEPAVMVGLGLIIRFKVVELEHKLFAPVKVYVVLTVGETTAVEVVMTPGFHVYVVAPAAVNVADNPAQIEVGDEDATTVGVATTFMFTVELLLQFNEDVAITVYTVVTEGEIATNDPVSAPGFHV